MMQLPEVHHLHPLLILNKVKHFEPASILSGRNMAGSFKINLDITFFMLLFDRFFIIVANS